MFGSNNIQFKWEFNKFLPKPFPQYEECYIEVTLYPTSIKFLPNAPYTKWFGMRECLINETMIMHNGTQPLTLQPDELDLLQTALYSLSVRSENICIVHLLPTFFFNHPPSFSPSFPSPSSHFFLFQLITHLTLIIFPFPTSLYKPPVTTFTTYIFIFRYEISFKELDPFHPFLSVRAIRMNETDAVSLIKTDDAASMLLNEIPLNSFRAQGITEQDGNPYALYPLVFRRKPFNLSAWTEYVNGYLPNFLALILTHYNHSLDTYTKAVRHNKTSNKQRFKYHVRKNNKGPMRDRPSTSGIYRKSKFGAKFSLHKYAANIPPHLMEPISLAKGSETWSSYQTGINTYFDYLMRTGQEMTMPLSLIHILGFISYCFRVKSLAPSTVNNYLSGLKALQALCNEPPDNFRSPIIDLVLKGYRNLFLTKLVSPKIRSVITYPILQILGEEIATLPITDLDKQIYWTAAVVAFWGSTRMGELLEGKDGFDKVRANTWSKVTLEDDTHAILHIALPKIIKNDSAPTDHVDVFDFPIKHFCPVHNLYLLNKMNVKRRNTDLSTPVFRMSNGRVMAKMNDLLKMTLDACFPNIGRFRCHSFRAGVPSIMGAFPQFFTEAMLKQQGRWASQACHLYSKHNGQGIRSTHDTVVRLLLKSRFLFTLLSYTVSHFLPPHALISPSKLKL